MFGQGVENGEGAPASSRRRLPRHCVRPSRWTPEVAELQQRLRRAGLRSVCEEARCPNRCECWQRRHLAFMLLGSVCTRACRFCAVATGRAIRERRPSVSIEVLTPDFRGELAAVSVVCEAAPDVFNHNVETVPRLYRRVRPGAVFERSLAVLAEARRLRPDAVVKSGCMVGLGEEFDEVVELLRALRAVGVDFVTIGQFHNLP